METKPAPLKAPPAPGPTTVSFLLPPVSLVVLEVVRTALFLDVGEPVVVSLPLLSVWLAVVLAVGSVGVEVEAIFVGSTWVTTCVTGVLGIVGMGSWTGGVGGG